ncbi:hypothetical protein ABQE44_04095 [Mycolicibacterium sp. XJ2546]
MSTATADRAASTIRSLLSWWYSLHPSYRLAVRWAFIVACTAVAFHDSIASVIRTTRNEGVGGYVWVVPAAAVLVAIGVARRHRTELPIHDRQTDIIVGSMGLVLAVLVQAVLVPRFALYFYLLRLDLVAMWLFVLSSSIVLFGLRPVIRFAWVWGLMFMVFSLPYYLSVVFLGGGKFAAGASTLIIAAIGTGIGVSDAPSGAGSSGRRRHGVSASPRSSRSGCSSTPHPCGCTNRCPRSPPYRWSVSPCTFSPGVACPNASWTARWNPLPPGRFGAQYHW